MKPTRGEVDSEIRMVVKLAKYTDISFEPCEKDMPCGGGGWRYLGISGSTRPELTQELEQLFNVYHSHDVWEIKRYAGSLYHYWMELDDAGRKEHDRQTGRD